MDKERDRSITKTKKKKRGEREISEKKGAGITWMHRKK